MAFWHPPNFVDALHFKFNHPLLRHKFFTIHFYNSINIHILTKGIA
jgi:hypothetical protein